MQRARAACKPRLLLVLDFLPRSDDECPMLIHEDYGKRVLARATNREVQFTGPSVHVDYGTKHPARIDATVGDIAVEMESRTAKQIRGAVVDLLLHPYRKKLLMIVPVHMQDQHVAAEQCRSIFQRQGT